MAEVPVLPVLILCYTLIGFGIILGVMIERYNRKWDKKKDN
jgi:hypothetical protein